MHSTVIFVCGEVLIQGMVGVQGAIARLTGCDEETVWREIQLDPKNEMFCGRISEQAYWEATIARNGWRCTPEQLALAMHENFTEVPGTRRIIEAVRTAGYKTGLLSVHTREWVEHCESHHRYHHLFDVIQYSYEVGIRKPDPRVFQKILRDLGASAHQTIFIDDAPKNITAAAELGICAIQFQSAEQIAEELGRLLGLHLT